MRADFDIFIEKLSHALVAFSDAQNPKLRFKVLTDDWRARQGKRGVYVHVNFASLHAQNDSKDCKQHRAIVNLDCISIAAATNSKNGSKITAERNRYLVQQIWEAIFDQNDPNLGMPVGAMANLKIDSVSAFPDDMAIELGFQGLRVVVSAEFGFNPAAATGHKLEEISATAPNWGAFFNNEEGN